MKKTTLFAIVFLLSAAAFTEPEKPVPPQGTEIELKEILVPPPPGSKTTVDNPIHAWYVQEQCMIKLSTDSQQGKMIVSIEDESGSLVLQRIVDGNNPDIDIQLPLLPAGYFTITIESKKHCLVGEFEVY